jgi:hypothetical protein
MGLLGLGSVLLLLGVGLWLRLIFVGVVGLGVEGIGEGGDVRALATHFVRNIF